MPLFAVIGVVTVLALGLWLLSLVPGWAWLTAVAFVSLALVFPAFEWLSTKLGGIWSSETDDRELLRRGGIVGPPMWLPPSFWSKDVKAKLAELKQQD